jgi:carbon monoxide dehydrogenase subunit G
MLYRDQGSARRQRRRLVGISTRTDSLDQTAQHGHGPILGPHIDKRHFSHPARERKILQAAAALSPYSVGMASIRNEVALAAPAADVWDAVKDFGALNDRLVPGFVTECQLDGPTRIVTFANGAVAREELVDTDDANRRLVYAIVGGRFTHYNASVQVFERGKDAATLVWIIDLLPNELAAVVEPMTKQAVAAMHRAFGTPPA